MRTLLNQELFVNLDTPISSNETTDLQVDQNDIPMSTPDDITLKVAQLVAIAKENGRPLGILCYSNQHMDVKILQRRDNINIRFAATNLNSYSIVRRS
jgi:hypothetical protein